MSPSCPSGIEWVFRIAEWAMIYLCRQRPLHEADQSLCGVEQTLCERLTYFRV